MAKREKEFSAVIEHMRNRTTDDSDIDYLNAFYEDYRVLNDAWSALRLIGSVHKSITRRADQIVGLPVNSDEV